MACRCSASSSCTPGAGMQKLYTSSSNLSWGLAMFFRCFLWYQSLTLPFVLSAASALLLWHISFTENNQLSTRTKKKEATHIPLMSRLTEREYNIFFNINHLENWLFNLVRYAWFSVADDRLKWSFVIFLKIIGLS